MLSMQLRGLEKKGETSLDFPSVQILGANSYAALPAQGCLHIGSNPSICCLKKKIPLLSACN